MVLLKKSRKAKKSQKKSGMMPLFVSFIIPFICTIIGYIIGIYTMAGDNTLTIIGDYIDDSISYGLNWKNNTSYIDRNGMLDNIKNSNKHAWHKYIATRIDDNIELNANQGDKGGQWNWCSHVIHYGPNFDRGIAGFISSVLQPKSLIEFGCGIGLYVNFISSYSPNGIHTENDFKNYINSNSNNDVTKLFVGIEPENMVGAGIFNSDNNYGIQLALNVFNVSKDVLDSIPKFDIVFTSEVLEHIPYNLITGNYSNGNSLLQFLVDKTERFLIFGAAHPQRQPRGLGHLKESMFPKEYWIDIFKKYGLIHLPILSEKMRNAAYDVHKGFNTFIMVKKKYFHHGLDNQLGWMKDVSDLWPEFHAKLNKGICKK